MRQQQEPASWSRTRANLCEFPKKRTEAAQAPTVIKANCDSSHVVEKRVGKNKIL